MYATDTRIGRGIMPPGKTLRCSLWGQERRFAVPRADRGKGAALFSAGDLTWCREVESRALHATDT